MSLTQDIIEQNEGRTGVWLLTHEQFNALVLERQKWIPPMESTEPSKCLIGDHRIWIVNEKEIKKSVSDLIIDRNMRFLCNQFCQTPYPDKLERAFLPDTDGVPADTSDCDNETTVVG